MFKIDTTQPRRSAGNGARAAIGFVFSFLFLMGMPGANAQCGASMVNRRTVLAYPSVAMAVHHVKPPARPSQGSQQNQLNDLSIVGLWNISFVSGGQVVDQGFDVWHSDGTELLNDTPPPASGNVCVGVWAQTSVLTYKLNHPSWTFDENGNLTGAATIKEEVKLDPSGDTFTGTFTVDVADLSGKNLMHLSGTVMAQRITVD